MTQPPNPAHSLRRAMAWGASAALLAGCSQEPVAPPASALPPAPPQGSGLRWIASGSGAGPDSTQASIEADLEHLGRLWGAQGRIYFAGGPESPGVQELAPARAEPDPLRAELAAFFAPRARAGVRYRAPRLQAAGPATRDALLGALHEALSGPQRGPLWLYLGGHGAMGARPDENGVALWGGDTLGVFELAAALDAARSPRPVRLVVTTCHAGGFAEVIFTDGDASRGVASGERCGLFATTWDRQAGGCDADPERRNHDGYAVHLLSALEGRDRDGAPRPGIDLNGDGVIGLLEAHVQAAIGSGSLDVPTTTSARWLRHAAAALPEAPPLALPEEARVIRELGARLGAPADAGEVRGRREALTRALEELTEATREASDQEAAAWYRLSAALLARWPLIDDPWHPGFEALLAAERPALEAFLRQRPEAQAWRDAAQRTDAAEARRGEAEVALAPWLRLEQAHESAALAGRLRAAGGAGWRRFEALRACERAPGPKD